MYKLGLKGPRLNSIRMAFGSYFAADTLPAVPVKFGRPWLVRSWGMYANDQYGDCVWAGAAHETMMLTADAGVSVPMFTTKTVLEDYAAVTGFTPHGDDPGTDLQEACAYRQKTGIGDQLGGRHQIDIYASLRPGDSRELELAVSILGSAGVGVQLPDTAEDQFNHYEPWMVEPGASIAGGHYIPCIGRNSVGDWLFVSWGRVQAATPEWVEEYMDQGVAYISRERLRRDGTTPEGINLAAMTDDYHQLTGA